MRLNRCNRTAPASATVTNAGWSCNCDLMTVDDGCSRSEASFRRTGRVISSVEGSVAVGSSRWVAQSCSACAPSRAAVVGDRLTDCSMNLVAVEAALDCDCMDGCCNASYTLVSGAVADSDDVRMKLVVAKAVWAKHMDLK